MFHSQSTFCRSTSFRCKSCTVVETLCLQNSNATLQSKRPRIKLRKIVDSGSSRCVLLYYKPTAQTYGCFWAHLVPRWHTFWCPVHRRRGVALIWTCNQNSASRCMLRNISKTFKICKFLEVLCWIQVGRLEIRRKNICENISRISKICKTLEVYRRVGSWLLIFDISIKR